MPPFLFSSTQGKRTGVFSKNIKRTRFSMLNFRAQKSIQSEFIALSPFLPMVFFKIILALLLLSKGQSGKNKYPSN